MAANFGRTQSCHEKGTAPMTSAPVRDPLADLLTDDKPLDRTTVNSWEDIEFLEAVRVTGRRKLIICALWTEV